MNENFNLTFPKRILISYDGFTELTEPITLTNFNRHYKSSWINTQYFKVKWNSFKYKLKFKDYFYGSQKTFSIIIPVYNVEGYLSQCLHSILNQTFTDFELLLVNDGSTDASLKICNDFKESDSRIIVIDKENGGASSARNEGIQNATGEYLIFVDSDDFIESQNLFSALHSKIQQHAADVILYSGKIITLRPIRVPSLEETTI